MIETPKAVAGPVMAMARPARPQAERAAVLAAAAGYPANWAVTRKASALASKVVAALMKELQSDPLVTTLQQMACESPVVSLVTDPEINSLDEIVERQVERLRARNGRYLSAMGQRSELREIADEIQRLLAGRYARHLRSVSERCARPLPNR